MATSELSFQTLPLQKGQTAIFGLFWRRGQDSVIAVAVDKEDEDDDSGSDEEHEEAYLRSLLKKKWKW